MKQTIAQLSRDIGGEPSGQCPRVCSITVVIFIAWSRAGTFQVRVSPWILDSAYISHPCVSPSLSQRVRQYKAPGLVRCAQSCTAFRCAGHSCGRSIVVHCSELCVSIIRGDGIPLNTSFRCCGSSCSLHPGPRSQFPDILPFHVHGTRYRRRR